MSFSEYRKAKAAKRRKKWASRDKRFADKHSWTISDQSSILLIWLILSWPIIFYMMVGRSPKTAKRFPTSSYAFIMTNM